MARVHQSRIVTRCTGHRHLASQHRNLGEFASTHSWRRFSIRQSNVRSRDGEEEGKGAATHLIHTGKSIGSVTLTGMPFSWAI